jgi:hypothetical protein
MAALLLAALAAVLPLLPALSGLLRLLVRVLLVSALLLAALALLPALLLSTLALPALLAATLILLVHDHLPCAWPNYQGPANVFQLNRVPRTPAQTMRKFRWRISKCA